MGESMEWTMLRVHWPEVAPAFLWLQDGVLTFRVALWRCELPRCVPMGTFRASGEGVDADGKLDDMNASWKGWDSSPISNFESAKIAFGRRHGGRMQVEGRFGDEKETRGLGQSNRLKPGRVAVVPTRGKVGIS